MDSEVRGEKMADWWVEVRRQDGSEETFFFDKKPEVYSYGSYVSFTGEYEGDFRELFVFSNTAVTAVLDYAEDTHEDNNIIGDRWANWRPNA
jgi:hypothetical protein